MANKTRTEMTNHFSKLQIFQVRLHENEEVDKYAEGKNVSANCFIKMDFVIKLTLKKKYGLYSS